MELSNRIKTQFNNLKQTEEGFEISLFLQNLKKIYEVNEFVITFVCSKMKNYINNYRHKTKRIICEEFRANEIVSCKVNNIIDAAFEESNLEKVLECFSDIYSNKIRKEDLDMPVIKTMDEHLDFPVKKENSSKNIIIKDTPIPKNSNKGSRRVFVEKEKKLNIIHIKEFKTIEQLKKNLAKQLDLKNVDMEGVVVKFFNQDTKKWDNLKGWKTLKDDETLKIFHPKKKDENAQGSEADISDESLDVDGSEEYSLPEDEESISPKLLLQNHIGEIINDYESSGGKKAWIKKFRLPSFDRKITKKMSRGENLSTKDRIMVCQKIHDYVVQFDSHPTSKELDVFLECLFLTYPRLVEEEDYWVTWKTWKVSIGNVFARGRRRKSKESVAKEDTGPKPVKEATSKKKLQDVDTARKPKRARQSLPAIHIGEEKMAPTDPPTETPPLLEESEALEATYLERRRRIISGNLDIQTVFIEYPWLHKETEIFTEFSRIIKMNQNIEEAIERGFQKMAPALLHLLKVQQKSRAVAEKEKEIKLCVSEKRCAADFDFSLALFALPFALGEDVETIFKHAGSIYEAAIQIEFSGGNSFEEADSFSVILEDVRVKCSSLKRAVAVFIASFFIFHLAYPSDLKMFLTFVEENVLDIIGRRPSRVVKLTERINDYFESKGEVWKQGAAS